MKTENVRQISYPTNCASAQMQRPTRPARFLLVDDDRFGIMSIQRALKKLGIHNETVTAQDGLQALNKLETTLFDQNGVLHPTIVLLDMNMPRMNGQEFLIAIGDDPAFHDLMVFVFKPPGTTRFAIEDPGQNVAGYLCKDNPVESLSRAFNESECASKLMI